jgi:hypothetical protein
LAVYQPIFLTGDYVNGKRDRQQMALQQQCLCVVEFHFNSSTIASRAGGEVHFQPDDEDSKQFAKQMWTALSGAGLPASQEGAVHSTKERTRSGWIDLYAMTTILLEPLYISNRMWATWLHNNEANLAVAIAGGIRSMFPFGGRIGLSAGHAGKSHGDPGARCVLAPKSAPKIKPPFTPPLDCEATHALTVSTLVGIELDMAGDQAFLSRPCGSPFPVEL